MSQMLAHSVDLMNSMHQVLLNHASDNNGSKNPQYPFNGLYLGIYGLDFHLNLQDFRFAFIRRFG